MLSIRPATPDDNARIDELFAQARAFMAQNGNPTQWTNGFPNAAMLQDGMRDGLVFVCCDDTPQADTGSGEVVGVYALRRTLCRGTPYGYGLGQRCGHLYHPRAAKAVRLHPYRYPRAKRSHVPAAQEVGLCLLWNRLLLTPRWWRACGF